MRGEGDDERFSCKDTVFHTGTDHFDVRVYWTVRSQSSFVGASKESCG
jgi:hypothetical protein